MRISYWSSDVCSSDLLTVFGKYLRKVVICSRDDYIREEPAPPTRQRADPTSVNIRNATVATSAPTIASPDTATRTKRCHLILSSRSSKTSTKSLLTAASSSSSLARCPVISPASIASEIGRAHVCTPV